MKSSFSRNLPSDLEKDPADDRKATRSRRRLVREAMKPCGKTTLPRRILF